MATVLVVEDDKLSQKILSKILGGAGHQAVLSANVKEAWAALRQHVNVDLVILDNQLERGWGWEFLREVRADLLYRDLPVIVYTGHTERSSILKYVELGVQAMLVKPYKGEAVQAEVEKALKVDWTARLLEKPTMACARLKIKESDYYSMLSTAAATLKANLKEIQAAAQAKREDPHLPEHLKQINAQGVALGMPLVKTLTDALGRAMAGGNHTAVESSLRSLEALQQLLHQRALASMGVGDLIAHSANLPEEKKAETPKPVYAPPSTPLETFCRRTAGAPIWTFARYFSHLGVSRPEGSGMLDTMIQQITDEESFQAFLEAVHWIEKAPQHMPDELLEAANETRGFNAAFLKVVRQIGIEIEDTDPEVAMRMAIDRLGFYKTTVLIGLARIARAVRVTSPLDLRMLTEHTLTTALLSYEFGRMLKRNDDHLVAAAGAAHDIGKWLFALGEPALYAASLGLAHGESRALSAAETELFGATHEEAGRRLLEYARAPVFLQTAAAFHSQPDAAETLAHRPGLAVVHLANHMSWASLADDPGHAAEIHQRLQAPTHPAWTTLAAAGVELPMDIPELMETMIGVARVSNWTCAVLIGN